MHVEVVQIVLVGRLVLSCGQPTETFLVEVDTQGVNAAQEDIDAEIKLQFVYQEWLVQVPLHDVVLVRVEVREISSEENASSLSSSFWLRDEGLAIQFPLLILRLIWKLLLEFAELCWQKPCLREKLVVFWVVLQHSLQISSKVVLAR